MRFNGKITLPAVAILASLILASALSKDWSALLSLNLALLTIPADIFLLNKGKNIMLPSGRISGRVAGVLLIRRSPCLR